MAAGGAVAAAADAAMAAGMRRSPGASAAGGGGGNGGTAASTRQAQLLAVLRCCSVRSEVNPKTLNPLVAARRGLDALVRRPAASCCVICRDGGRRDPKP